ncbi:MAG: histidine phosphatase family protein [Oscillospiraceae bacterium]
MTTVYFVRHAQSDRFALDDRTRPLTAEGMQDAERVTAALADKGITRVLSSPYTRTMQTVSGLAGALGLPIETDEDFRERNAGTWRGENFLKYIEAQWADFGYHIEDGECLADVQARNIAALKRALEKYPGETLAIATHGTALSTILNKYFPEFGYADFMRILDAMPYIVRLDFDGEGRCAFKEEILMILKQYK